MQLCIAMGASVYVTSGHAEKIQKAIQAGATAGANYKDGESPPLPLSSSASFLRQQTGPPSLQLFWIINSWMP